MGIAERKEREKEDVRKKILDAAHDLFEAQGYENVTMRAVADAIEYSPTTIYLHFANKDALVEALCFEDFERLSARMNQAPLPENPIERMRALGRVRGLRSRQPEPLPLHVHDVRRLEETRARGRLASLQVVRGAARRGLRCRGAGVLQVERHRPRVSDHVGELSLIHI